MKAGWIALVLLGNVLSSAYRQAQLNTGIFSPKIISVGDLLVGVLIPGLLLVVAYSVYMMIVVWLQPETAPDLTDAELKELDKNRQNSLLMTLLPPITLIIIKTINRKFPNEPTK